MSNKKNARAAETKPDIQVEEPQAPAKKGVAALFEGYEAADAAVEAAKVALESAMRARSDAVFEIYSQTGKSAFLYKGEKLTIVARGKKGSAEKTYFFKGKKKEEDLLEVV